MSSDSELDEFVDALDETPEDNAGKKIVSPRVDSPVEQTDDVEEEEKRLFKLQKKAEERRRKEDEELRKRWESVQKKKEEERLQQIEEQQWKEAERSRKRKLEEMRLRMLEESTPSKNRSSSSSEEDYPRSDNEDSTNQETGASHVTLEQKSSSVLVTPEKLSSIASSVITSANDTNNDAVLQSQTSLGERAEVITTGSSVIESRPVELIEEQLRRSEAVSVEIAEQSTPVVSPLPNLSVPEICCEQESLVEGDNSVIDNSVFIVSGLTHEEPDIVKSAKLRQVPVTLQPPVAPPRRRKKRDEVLSDFSVEGQSSGCSLLESPGLPPAVPTPTSTVESLTRELENSLDIQSAIGGDRHVHAQDAEIGAVNSDHSSPASLPSPTPLIPEVATSDPVTSQKEAPPSKAQEDKEKTTVDSPTDEPDPLGRPRSNSGRLLTDEEILEMVMVVNLDTGEKVPLNLAEEALPKCVNPLSLHIMRRTKEYSSDSSLHKDQQLSEDEIKETDKTLASLETSARRKATKFKKFLGKTVGKTVSRVKSVADQSKKVLHGDDVEEEVSVDGKRFKFKACSHNKGPYDFQQFRTLQDLGGEHTGAVWTMKFSPCGRLLATGGQDNILRVWILKSACLYFEDLRHRYSETDLNLRSDLDFYDEISPLSCRHQNTESCYFTTERFRTFVHR